MADTRITSAGSLAARRSGKHGSTNRLAGSPETVKKASRDDLRGWSDVLGRLLSLLRETPKPQAPKARRRRPARPRDFQRRRVYAWEAAVLQPTVGPMLSLDACAALIDAAYRWHERPAAATGWQPPRLGDGRGRRHACGSRDEIKLPRWARTRTIVLHECAHGMADDGHGPGFVRAYVTLLCAFDDRDRDALEASLRQHKVRIAPAG